MARTYCVEQARDERLHLLAVRRREARLRELVRGVLVLADPLELRLDAQLVEGALEERDLGGEARHVQHRGRRGRDLRAARGEEVLLVARELEVRPGGLAAAPEAHEGVAQLPTRAQPVLTEPTRSTRPFTAGSRRAIDGLDQAADGGRAALEEPAEPGRRLLRHVARQSSARYCGRRPGPAARPAAAANHAAPPPRPPRRRGRPRRRRPRGPRPSASSWRAQPSPGGLEVLGARCAPPPA